MDELRLPFSLTAAIPNLRPGQPRYDGPVRHPSQGWPQTRGRNKNSPAGSSNAPEEFDTHFGPASVRSNPDTTSSISAELYSGDASSLLHDVADRRVWSGNLVTGDPLIDAATPKLLAALVSATASIDDGPLRALPARVRGSLIHGVWAKLVRSLAETGQLGGSGPLDIEITRLEGEMRKYGALGSARADFVLRDQQGQILAIYDVKTGKQRLSDKRVGNLLDHFHASADTKVFSFSRTDPSHTTSQ